MYNNGSTRLYNVLMGNPVANNSIGRMGGTGGAVNDENYFQRRAKSIGNALGTTAAAVASKAKDDLENANTDRLRQSNKDRMNNIAKKYGFDTWSDWQDAFYAAKDSGDSARVSEMENQLEEFKAQANSNAAETKKKADEYEDYRKNNFISEKINQDQGKFAGSAINTLSTAADVAMLLTGNPGGIALNATQGGLEGLADELEQNGFQNFDAGRASSNMLAGVAGGAAAGKLNKAIGGRNLVPGAGKLSNLGNRALNTGLARGAAMGAVGGGVGAGAAAALNGQDVLGSAMEGVKQGAVQGAIAGGVMSGATKATNAALNRFSPETAQRVQNNAQAWENWKNSGSDFNERLTNTLTSGDSAVGEWIQGNRQSGLLNRAGGIGNRVQDVSGPFDAIANKNRHMGVVERGDEFGSGIADLLESADNIAKLGSGNEVGNKASQFIDRYRGLAQDVGSWPKGDSAERAAIARQMLQDYKDINGGFVDQPMQRLAQYANDIESGKYSYQGPTTAGGWLKQAGNRIVEDINNSNLGNRIQDVSGDNSPIFRTVDQSGNRTDYTASDVRQLIDEYENYQAPRTLSGNSSSEVTEAMGRAGTKLSEIFRNQNGGQFNPYSRADGEAFNNWIQNTKNELGPLKARDVLGGNSGEWVNGEWRSSAPEIQSIAKEVYNKIADKYGTNDADAIFGELRFLSKDGASYYPGHGEKLLDEAYKRAGDLQEGAEIQSWLREAGYGNDTPTTVGGWLKQAGRRAVEDINNSNLGNRIQDVPDDSAFQTRASSLGDDLAGWDRLAQDAGFENYGNAYQRFSKANPGIEPNGENIAKWLGQRANTPETEVYRTLTAKQENTPSVKDAENTLKTSKSSQLRYQAAQELLKQYGTVDKPTAKATNAPETIQKIAEAGFTKPGDVERIADNITGSNGEVNKLVQKLVASAKPVNTFDGLDGNTLTQFIDESIARNALNGINEGTAVKKQIEAYLNSLPSRRNGSISGTDDALEVMDVVRKLEAAASNYEGRSGNNYATTNQDKLNAAKVTKEVASLLKDRIFDTVDVKSALTPEVAADLKALAPKNEQWGKYVDEKIMTAKNVQDLRSIQAPWVRAKRIIDNGYLNSVTYGGRIGNSAPSLDRRNFVSNALDSVWNSNIAQRGKAIALNKAADIVDRTPLGQGEGGGAPRATETTGNTPTPPPATQVYNAIGRMEAVDNGERASSAQYLANAAQEAEIVPNTGANTLESLASPTIGTGTTSVYDSMYGSPATEIASAGANSNSYFPTTGDYWVDLLGTAMTSAINAKDVDAFTSLYGMYQDALAQTSKNGGKDYSDPTTWSNGDRTKLLDAQNALGQIDTLESAYNQATGGNGGNVLQGNLRSLAANISGGNLDPSASNYNNLAQSIGMGIVKNMISLGVTEADAQRYLQYLPSLTDTQQQATQKLATLRQIYQNQIDNLYSAYGA